MQRSLRLPLQVGTSSLEGVARSAAALAPGLLFVGSFLVPALLSPWDEALETYEQTWWLILILILIGIAVVSYGWKHMLLAFRERPSDIVLASDGLRIAGGPNRWFFCAWKDIKPDDVRVVGRHDNDLELLGDESTRELDNFWELKIGDRVLASAEDKQEAASLQALRDSIRASAARVQNQAEGVAAPSGPVTDLHCNNCGAPVAPADQDWVQCGFCSGWVAISQEIRSRIRAVMTRDTNRRDAEKLVDKLLRQPGALRANLAIAVAALPSFGVWLVIMGIAAVLYVLCFFRFWNGLLLTVAGFASIRGLFYLVRGQLTDRQALRLLTLHFSARAPTRAGEPHRCRSCNAPLVEPPGTVLVACVYCGAENVLGLDARHDASDQKSEKVSLQETLETRRKEHRRWRWAGVKAIGLLAVAAILVGASLGPPHDLSAQGESGNLERITYDPENEFNPAPSPGGGQLVLYDLRVPEEEGDDAVMACGQDGAFRGTEYTYAGAHARRPVWIPDRSGFVYVAELSDGSARLERTLSPARYASARDIARAGYDIGVPSVSPDSTRVVYAAERRRHGGYSLYISTLDGAQHKYLGPGVDPAWSPDGVAIAYSRTIGSYLQIKIRDPDGAGSPKTITSGYCDHEDPVWSADGAYIAYLANCGHAHSHSGIWNLYVMRPDGSDVQQLTTGTTYLETPAWSGDYIYFSANVAGNFDLWRLTLGGTLAGHGVRRGPHKS
jgi:uncharacterized Zn finger protein (UPF0148 family)